MDIDDGAILIGGQDISKLRQCDLRSLIAYVPQDPAMFHRTLRENIAFARPEATDAEIRQAAEAAHVSEFADALPDGFDTMVGERGVKLSGGQREAIGGFRPDASTRHLLQVVPQNLGCTARQLKARQGCTVGEVNASDGPAAIRESGNLVSLNHSGLGTVHTPQSHRFVHRHAVHHRAVNNATASNVHAVGHEDLVAG